MANLVTIGLAKIEIGAKGAGGTMGSSLAIIGHTAEGSCTIETADPEVTEFFAEESDTPIHSFSKRGATTITFQLASPDLAQCAAVFGGTVDDGPPETWDYPDSYVPSEKSVLITPKEGLVFAIPRAKLEAKFTGQFGRTDTLKIEITLTVLMPEGEGVAPMQLSKVA